MNDELCLGDIVEELLEGPCWVVDVLPRQVPSESAGQFFAVERHLLSRPRVDEVFSGFASVLLKLNCYVDLHVSKDYSDEWEKNPDPSLLEAWVRGCASEPGGVSGVNVVVCEGDRVEALISVHRDDLAMAIYGADDELLQLIGMLASSEGLFLWKPPERP